MEGIYIYNFMKTIFPGFIQYHNNFTITLLSQLFWQLYHLKSSLEIETWRYQDIIIFDGKKIIKNKTEVIEVVKNHYINIGEKSSGEKPRQVARDNNIENKRIAIQEIKEYLGNHPIIKQIQENVQRNLNPSFNGRSWKTTWRR